MKVSLIINSKKFLNVLKSSLKKVFENPTLEINENESLRDTSSDILFFELISREDISKIALAKSTFKNTEIIFSSFRDDFVFEVLHLKPLYFIRQNNLATDIPKVEEILKNFSDFQNTILTFQNGGLTVRLDLKNILYIESYGHYLNLHTTSGTYKIREKLYNLEANYPFLFRCHKSYIVNPSCIKEKTSTSLLLINNLKIPLGKAFISKFSNLEIVSS